MKWHCGVCLYARDILIKQSDIFTCKSDIVRIAHSGILFAKSNLSLDGESERLFAKAKRTSLGL